MKITKALFSMAAVLIVLSIAFLLSNCKPAKDKPMPVKISGQVVDAGGNPISSGEAIIYVWNDGDKEPREVKVDIKEGKLGGELPAGTKYVVNIHAKGYGFVSKVYFNNLPLEPKFEMKKATVVSVVPATGGTVTDTQNNCPGSLSFRANWAANPLAGVPLQVNADGEVSGFGMPTELNDAYYFHANAANCNNNIRVVLPPNSIAAPGSVSVSMSTIDLFSPDGMPGDNIADFGSGSAFMESFGAFSLEIYDDKKSYNLNLDRKAQATVIFPTDILPKSQIKELPESIPLLYYNEKTGEWKSEGTATLDRKNNVYTANIFHFSAINLDIEKINPACIRFSDDTGDGFDPPYNVEITVPPSGGGSPIVRNRVVDPSALCGASTNKQFAFTRLPGNTFVSATFFDSSLPPTPKAIFVVKTPAPNVFLQNPAEPNCDTLELCGNLIQLVRTSPFIGHDTLIAACKDGASIIISIATKEATFNPALFRIEIARLNGTNPCTMEANLSSLTIIEDTAPSPPTINFRTLKYSMPTASLCNPADAAPTETIILELISTGVRTSNLGRILPICQQ